MSKENQNKLVQTSKKVLLAAFLIKIAGIFMVSSSQNKFRFRKQLLPSMPLFGRRNGNSKKSYDNNNLVLLQVNLNKQAKKKRWF